MAPPKRSAPVVKAEYAEMLNAARRDEWPLKCLDKPEKYSDYQNSPSAEEAKEMCEGCPMEALCREYALITKPEWTVLGGISWVRGKQFGSRAQIAEAAQIAA